RFLTECPSVAYKLENDEFSRKDLHVLVDEFNICIDTKSTAQEKVISIKQAQTKKINHWDNLYDKVNALADFNGKGDALEMINEIKSKISRAEKIPNFMVEGLKESLKTTAPQEDLNNALNELK